MLTPISSTMRTLLCIAITVSCAASMLSADAASWQQRTSMPYARSDFHPVTVSRQVYVLGGCVANQTADPMQGCSQITANFTVYDMEADTWTVLTPAPNARFRYAAAASPDSSKLYFVGGRDITDQVVQPIDVFDRATATWSSLALSTSALAAFEHERSDAAAVTLNNHMLLIGGYDATYTTLKDVLALDFANLTAGFQVGKVADKPTAAGDLAALVINGEVYAVGGFGTDFCVPSDTLERYTPSTNSWTTLAPLVKRRGDLAAAVLGNVLYIMGGETKAASCTSTTNQKSFAVADVESFDTTVAFNATWQVVSPLAVTRFRFGAAADQASGTIFDLGGQGAQVVPADAPAGAAADPSYYGGYFPALHSVFSLQVANPNPNLSGAGLASTSIVSMLAAVAALIMAARVL